MYFSLSNERIMNYIHQELDYGLYDYHLFGIKSKFTLILSVKPVSEFVYFTEVTMR
jgi:hypothetical protein